MNPQRTRPRESSGLTPEPCVNTGCRHGQALCTRLGCGLVIALLVLQCIAQSTCACLPPTHVMTSVQFYIIDYKTKQPIS